jgi:hypothetical protein
MSGQLHIPASTPVRRAPGTHWTEGWVGPGDRHFIMMKHPSDIILYLWKCFCSTTNNTAWSVTVTGNHLILKSLKCVSKVSRRVNVQRSLVIITETWPNPFTAIPRAFLWFTLFLLHTSLNTSRLSAVRCLLHTDISPGCVTAVAHTYYILLDMAAL